MLKSVLVTGGCGFIGSNFLNHMIVQHPDVLFINLDKLDYCARTKNVEYSCRENYKFVEGDIGDGYLVLKILNQYSVDAVVHFAAYSHVDNSFDNSVEFTKNNVLGTHQLLEACRMWGRLERFVHVSTDEVYGEIENGACREDTILAPTNPYSASKAGAEMLVNSYIKSYKFPAIITRGNNVYGPRQYPEKLIPKFIYAALDDEPWTVHGEGKAARNFIYVSDVVHAFETILFKGEIGEIYNIGTEQEYTVLGICKYLEEHMDTGSYIRYVEDRAFNDNRYAIHSDKLIALGWKQEVDFEEGMAKTIKWYSENSKYFI